MSFTYAYVKNHLQKKVIIELHEPAYRQVKFDKFVQFDDDIFSFDKNYVIFHTHFSDMKTLSY